MATVDYIHVPMYGGTTTVPASTEITVAAGDTLYSLARENNTTVEELARVNGLVAPYGLYVGQKLAVPGKTTAPSVQTVSVPVRTAPNTTTRVQLREITVTAGDTLYS
ncbi:MAG: LysM peptidoglycan-binding domain-containing protein, partial [Proteobacteria bacterium]|nr:LysM peptidoglycan-binding domain-containing protein [Candidatus Enterousia avistercoris]